MQAVCGVCQTSFEAKRSTAKFCGDSCRQQAHRGTKSSGSEGLVESVRRELEDAEVVDTYPAQLAIELARQMTTAGATGIASLSKELRTVMVSALEGATPGDANDADEVEDEVEKARQARERKTRNAAG